MRQEAIEAMATKLDERWVYEDNIDASQVALDGLLDYLEASAVEWVGAAGKETGFYPHGYVVDGLLSVLREVSDSE
jgi:hypothetical protein